MPLTSAETPHILLPVALLGVVSFLVNTTLVGIGASLMSGVRFVDLWKSNFAWTIQTQAAMTVLGLALAQVVATVGAIGLVLFIVPLLISRQLYERYVRLKSAYAETVRSLVAVIEAKDEYTRGHSERVAEYAVGIANQLRVPPTQVERLELAALLHDLGKVGISRRILSKPGRLDDEEFRLIQEHPAIGARIVASVPFLRDLVPPIAAHHERLDGSGYGERLTAELIPFEARILSVADAFDAMTSSRSYRPRLSRSDTLSELERGRGTQFDEECLDALLQCLESGSLAWPEGCLEAGRTDAAG
jgi:putative nucleotidyltransferase with HDIG domain